MRIIKSYITKFIFAIIGLLSSLYLFDKVSSLFGHRMFVNFLVFIGAYFMISVLLVTFWNCCLSDQLRQKIKSYEDIWVPLVWFHFMIALIIWTMRELSINANKK